MFAAQDQCVQRPHQLRTPPYRTTPPDEACIDLYLRAYDRNSGVEDAMNAYLTWEIELANQIKRDDTVVFGVGDALWHTLILRGEHGM